MSPTPTKRWDVLRACLFALIVLGISRIHQHFSVIGMLRPGLLLAAIGILAAFVNPSVLAPGWTRRFPTRLVIGMTIATFGSMVFGISQGGSWYYFSNNYSKVLIGAFLLVAGIRHTRDLSLLVWGYLVGSAILVWMALFVFQMSMEPNGVMRLGGMETWDANDIGVLLLMGLPLVMLVFRTSGVIARLFSAVVLLGMGATIARSGSRGAFLGLAVVLLVYVLTMKSTPAAARVGVVIMMFVGLLVAAPPGYWKQMNTINSVEEDYNWDADQGRRQLAIRGFKYMMAYPVFGLGLENFGRAEGTISERARRLMPGDPGIKWSAPHNTYIEAGAELGVPGFLIFCSLVLGCVIMPWRLRRRIPASWAKGDFEQRFLYESAYHLPLAAIGFAVPATFVSFAYNDPIYILAAFTGAAVAQTHQRLARDARGGAVGVVPSPRYQVRRVAGPVSGPVGARPVFPGPQGR